MNFLSPLAPPLLAIPFPSWLKPEIIPGLPFRWYGLMYIVAFGIAYILYRRQVRERNFPISEDELQGLFFWSILSLVVGARVFAALVYETSEIYVTQPWLIFWPFRDGQFTGLQGMSYHGGAIAGASAFLIYSKIKKWDVREIADMWAPAIPLGYTFGRLGNFINAELYGRATTAPWGMVFPHAELINGVNLPRHPSQLYEAFFEGLVMFAILWLLRNRKPFKGFLFGLYIVLYGFFRFFIEYFREPDRDLGYRIELAPNDQPLALAHPLTSFSTGQILCFGMVVFGIAVIILMSRLPNRAVIRVYSDSGGKIVTEAEKSTASKQKRKLRKSLKKRR
jgi:phosphatidylglycerol:prolipoprotein diacylglycerol transferase